MKKKYVIITRSAKDSRKFAKNLKQLGLNPLYCPTIEFIKNLSGNELKRYLSNLSSYDWIFFTSGNGVKFFMESLKEIKKAIPFEKVKIAAVGEKTAQTMNRFGMPVSFLPSSFSSENLIKEIPDLKGKKVLLPRSVIGDPKIIKKLEEIRASATSMPIYKTINPKRNMAKIEHLLKKNQIGCITFTSPSTVKGFVKNIDEKVQKPISSIPVLSIGPTTTRFAKKYGFTSVYTANIHTTDGMLAKLKENIL